MRILNISISCVLMLISCFLCSPTHAIPDQPGTLDATWAPASAQGAGRTIISAGYQPSLNGTAVTVQADGKVLQASTCSFVTLRFCVLRYSAVGTLDSSFQFTGQLMLAILGVQDIASAITSDSAGNIVVAGACKSSLNKLQFCLLRLGVSGGIDSYFGTGGSFATSVGDIDDRATAITALAGRQLVVAGRCRDALGKFAFCVIRVKSDGTLDTSFGTNGSLGRVLFPFAGLTNSASAVAIQPDGKIVIAGSCEYFAGKQHFCVARLNADGSPDYAGFSGGNHGASADISVGGGVASATSMALQPDGKIVLAGSCENVPSATTDFCAARFNSDGSLDPTFGTAGLVLTAVGGAGWGYASSVATQPDGKVVLGGHCLVSSFLGPAQKEFCAVRYHGNGALDTSFAASGKVAVGVGTGNTDASAMALQSDGKLVLVGSCKNTSLSYDDCAVRFDGGPFGYQGCKLDLDGDGQVLATTDALIHARIALGMTGSAVVNGINFSPSATRNTWPLVRNYLVAHCGMLLP